jgi:hypothetical protein
MGRVGWFRVDLIPAVRTAIRLLKPLLDTMVAEHMLAVGKPQRSLNHALGSSGAEIVVADDAT